MSSNQTSLALPPSLCHAEEPRRRVSSSSIVRPARHAPERRLPDCRDGRWHRRSSSSWSACDIVLLRADLPSQQLLRQDAAVRPSRTVSLPQPHPLLQWEEARDQTARASLRRASARGKEAGTSVAAAAASATAVASSEVAGGATAAAPLLRLPAASSSAKSSLPSPPTTVGSLRRLKEARWFPEAVSPPKAPPMPLRLTSRGMPSSPRHPSVAASGGVSEPSCPTDGLPTGVLTSCPCSSNSTVSHYPEGEEATEKEEEEAMFCGGWIARLFLCAFLPTGWMKRGSLF